MLRRLYPAHAHAHSCRCLPVLNELQTSQHMLQSLLMLLSRPLLCRSCAYARLPFPLPSRLQLPDKRQGGRRRNEVGQSCWRWTPRRRCSPVIAQLQSQALLAGDTAAKTNFQIPGCTDNCACSHAQHGRCKISAGARWHLSSMSSNMGVCAVCAATCSAASLSTSSDSITPATGAKSAIIETPKMRYCFSEHVRLHEHNHLHASPALSAVIFCMCTASESQHSAETQNIKITSTTTGLNAAWMTASSKGSC